MKMRKIISLLTTAMLVFTLMPAGVVLADSFTVVSTSPGDGATNVSVLDDLTITFSSAVDSSTLTSDNIIITGGNAYFTVDMQSDTVATVMFDTALDYGTTYEVLLTSNITDTNQNPLTETEFSFKTQENPITLLFEEDFEGDAQEALEKFEQIWTTMEEGESFEVANNALSITALGDTKAGDNWEGRPVLQIKGSENWEDYEVEFDFFRNGERAYPNILLYYLGFQIRQIII